MLGWINHAEAALITPNCVPLAGPEIHLGEGDTNIEEQVNEHCTGCLM